MLTSRDLIEHYISLANDNLKRMNSTFTSLSEPQLNWKPEAGIWSVEECINHLVATNELYYKKMSELVISRDTSNIRNFDYAQSLLGKLLAKAVDPQNVKKVKTFKVFNPGKSSFQRAISEEYNTVSRKIMELVRRFEGVNLKKVKFSSPVNKLIRINLGDPLIIIPKHDERHFDQAERIMNSNGFPKE